jgi:exopolysaccharide biosynthesis polyprenyl glycosylphosphotransferase
MRLPLWTDWDEPSPSTHSPAAAPDTAVGDTAGTRRFGLLGRLLTTDLVALQLAWWLSYLLYPQDASVATAAIAGLVNTLAGLVLLGLSHLYRSRVAAVRQTELSRLVVVAVGSAFASFLAFGVIDPALQSAGNLALTMGFTFSTLTVGRSFFDEWLRAQRTLGYHQRSIVVAGNGNEVQYLVELLNDHPEFGLQVKQVVWTIDVEDPTLLSRVSAALTRTGSHGVLLTAQGLAISDKRELISVLAQRGVHMHLSSGLWGIDYRRVRAVPIAHEPLLYVEPADRRRTSQIAKRAIDIAGSLFLLVLCSPVLIAAAIAILIDDGWPVLFHQDRVGQKGQIFGMLKLRSMVCGAESRVAEVIGENERDGPLYKNDGSDPRITRVGRFIRALSIDELPQLINVLKGEMSLVGPRPALPQEVAEFDEELRGRLRARPGITGLWQVEARDKPSFSAYKRLDLFYIDNWSSLLDVVIMVMTVQSVLGRGIRMLRPSQRSKQREPSEAPAGGPSSVTPSSIGRASVDPGFNSHPSS